MIPSTGIWTAVLLLSPFAHGVVIPKADAGNQVIKAHYNPAYKSNRHALTHALRKWYLRTGINGHVPATGMKGEIANMTSTPTPYDQEWVTTVGFGTPPQWVTMDLDTGSSDVWVFSDLMDAQNLDNRTYYRPDQSTTATELANSSWWIQYGDQSTATGTVYLDTINLGGIDIKNAAVEAATKVSVSLQTDHAISGVFGLTYNFPNEISPQTPTVLKDLTALLDQKLFTVDLKWHANGEYQFGHIDHSKYTGEIQYVPLVAENHGFWKVGYSLFTFDTIEHWHAVDRKAIIDTGTTLLLMDEDVVSSYYNTVQGAFQLAGSWFYPCNNTLPDFVIGFSDEAKYTIPGQYMKFAEDPEEAGEGMCQGGLQSGGDLDFSIFGDIFLKAVFAVFDLEKGAVGFAPKVLDPFELDTPEPFRYDG